MIVQILVMFFDTSTIAENDLEHLVSLYTRSAYHHRIRSDYHNDPTVLIYNKKNCQTTDLTYANLICWVSNTHTNRSAGLM